MIKDKLTYLAGLEKAIAKKYGKESIINPKASWDNLKEDSYKEQLKEFELQEYKREEEDVDIYDAGFFIPQKLITNESNRECPVCTNYSFNIKDDIYMNKFECCFNCYIDYIEGREERWKKGWRPLKSS